MIVTLIARIPDDKLEDFQAGGAALLERVEGFVYPPFTWALPMDGTTKLATWAKLVDLMGEERASLLLPEVAADVIAGNYDEAGALSTDAVPTHDVSA